MKNKLITLLFLALLIAIGFFAYNSKTIKDDNIAGSNNVIIEKAQTGSAIPNAGKAKIRTASLKGRLNVELSLGSDLQVLNNLFKNNSKVSNKKLYEFTTIKDSQELADSIDDGIHIGSVSEFLDGIYNGKPLVWLANIDYQTERFGLSYFKPEEKDKIKKIAMFLKGNISDLDSKLLIKSFGFEPADVKYVKVNSDFEAVALVKNKEADIALISSMNDEYKKDYNVFYIKDISYLPFKMIYANKEVIKNEKKNAASFIKDLYNTIESFKKGDINASTFIKDGLKIKDPSYEQKLLANFKSVDFAPNLKYIVSINQFVAAEKNADILDTNEYIDDSFANNVIPNK